MSQQNAQTPREFILAVETYFNVKFTFDLACTTLDKVCEKGYFFDEGIDALKQDWSKIEWRQNEAAWLNPPWKQTKKFAKKCAQGNESYIWDSETQSELWMPGAPIFSLFPAGVGSDWFSEYVLGQAAVYCLNPRITFLDPRTGQPFINAKGKPQTGLNDCILIDWACTKNDVGVYSWKWKEKKSRKGVKRGPRRPKTVAPAADLGLDIPDNVFLSPLPGDAPVPAAVPFPVGVTVSGPIINAPKHLEDIAHELNATVPEIVVRAQSGEWAGSLLEKRVLECLTLIDDDHPILQKPE